MRWMTLRPIRAIVPERAKPRRASVRERHPTVVDWGDARSTSASAGNSVEAMLSRVLLSGALALLPASCGSEHVGLTRASAIKAAKAYVVRVDYRGNEPLFYRNTGNRPASVRRARDAQGHQQWLIRFDDFQAMRRHCVSVRRNSSRLVATGISCRS